jgi:hypothetical protein
MQSIFRPASRREALGKHSKGGRRGGGLKMDGQNRCPERCLCVLIAGGISGEDLKGHEAVSGRGSRAWLVGLPVASNGVDGQDLFLAKCA